MNDMPWWVGLIFAIVGVVVIMMAKIGWDIYWLPESREKRDIKRRDKALRRHRRRRVAALRLLRDGNNQSPCYRDVRGIHR